VPKTHALCIPETFVYPVGPDNFLLYSPLAGLAAQANRDGLAILRALKERYPNPWLATFAPELYRVTVELMRRVGLLRPEIEPPYLPRFQRDRVDLFLTSDCNLHCVYCFASAGERPRTLPWEIAQAALDLTVKSALKKGQKGVKVLFGGNGEPFVAWPLMVQCTTHIRELARQHGLDCQISCVTNGYLTPKLAAWAAENIDELYISLDGPPDIHDIQRPTRGNRGSFSRVVEAIREIDRTHGSYGLRATITSLNAARMDELADFVIGNFPRAKFLQIDPLFPCHRSREAGWEPPRVEDFVVGFLKIQPRFDRAGLELLYTGFDLTHVSPYHCNVAGIKPAITPEGLVTHCPEVATLEDERSSVFIYGRYDVKKAQFDYDWGRLRRLMAHNLRLIAYCTHCMARWQCGGECASKNMLVGSIDAPSKNFRCMINRLLFPHQVARWLNRAYDNDGISECPGQARPVRCDEEEEFNERL
jgi:radical SAM protein with 4Fe4S-binding SPASM domain